MMLGHWVSGSWRFEDNTIVPSSLSTRFAAIISDVTWYGLCNILQYRFRSSGIWCWVIGWAVPGILKDRSALIFKGHELFHSGCLDPWGIHNHSPWHAHHIPEGSNCRHTAVRQLWNMWAALGCGYSDSVTSPHRSACTYAIKYIAFWRDIVFGFG